MKTKKFLYSVILLLVIFTFFSILPSCVAIKPYQKNMLNQEDMKLSQYKTEVYDNSIESYREGASGANGGRTGGGCGCN